MAWHRVTECLPIILHYGKKKNDENIIFGARKGEGMGWHTDSSRTVLVWSAWKQEYIKTSLHMSYGTRGGVGFYSIGWWNLQMSDKDQWMELPATRLGYPAPLDDI